MSKTRNLSDLLDANGDVKSTALDNVPPSNDASALTTGTLDSARLGTITNFTSTGIDDNATSTAVTIDSSNNLLVDKTSSSGSVAGCELRAGGRIFGTSDANAPLFLNRLTSDGTIATFRKDGNEVGTIYNGGSNLGINSQGGLLLVDDIITPTSGADNTKDLGRSSARWKDLYLGGNIYLGGTGSANALDDYETGTFTITLTPSTSGSLTLSSTSDSCYYTKVGRTVFVQGRIVVDASSSPTGSALDVGGLPFTIQSPSEGAGYFGGMCAISFNGSNTFDAFPITAYSASGTTKITCSSVSSMNSNTRIHFNFFYYTAS